jgi:hypothetical protein
MSWTVTDDDNDIIQVRASINVQTQQDELRDLIYALDRRLRVPDATILLPTKEPTNGTPTP